MVKFSRCNQSSVVLVRGMCDRVLQRVNVQIATIVNTASEDAAMCRFGYNTWRDPMKPTAILEKMCKEAGIDQPQYKTGCVTVAGEDFFEQEVVENEQGLLATVLVLRFVMDKAY